MISVNNAFEHCKYSGAETNLWAPIWYAVHIKETITCDRIDQQKPDQKII